MNLSNRHLLLFVLIITFTFSLFSHFTHAETVPFDSSRWVMQPNTSRLEDHLGQKSLYLKGGTAYLKDVNFTNGIIEFDVAFSRERGFFGAMFRMQDKENYEEFYLRSHQSGNPDAIQYSPVYNRLSAWQLYHGEGYSAAVTFHFDRWMHVKLMVSGKIAELYIDNNETPVMFMHDLKREIKPGLVGVKALPFSAGHFANFSVTTMDNPLMKSKSKSVPEIEAGTVMIWEVSGTFAEQTLDKKSLLSAAEKEPLKWKKLECEGSGLANFSKISRLNRMKNTVFARITIDSHSQQIKKLKFGFSDRIKVYLNDRLLYAGNNNYRSRDYRYLGTIGYFDELALPLQKGKNELWMAVSENFGGWGIKCRFEDMNGITLRPAAQ
ncbi:MAG: hypothetical protein PVH61_09695 [Candidatus Aminicenantes bacterium]|jgi:hypothetical protein